MMDTYLITWLLQLLPGLLWLGRIAITALALLLIVQCARSLLSGHSEQEIWGVLTMPNGGRYELTHWENTIGRARSADVRINFPSVSRSHAALCRDESGHWKVYPLNSRSGVLLNGKHIFQSSLLAPGDSIAVGGVELYFFPATKEEESAQANRRTKPGRRVSPAAMLSALTVLQALLVLQFVPYWTTENRMPILIGFGGICVLQWLLYGLYRLLRRTAYELETLVFFLISVGFAMTAAYQPEALYKQLLAVLIGITVYFSLSLMLRSLRLSVMMRWPVAAAAAALLTFNVLFGEQIFGARNWISIGPFSFQPSEMVKIAFVLAGAATLDRLFARRNLIFTLLFSAFCVGCLALMSDFGTALIFFTAFLCIAFLRTGDAVSLVMMVGAAGLAGGIVLRFKPYIADRFTVWLHAWEYTQTTGYQQSRTMSAAAAGGLFGAGPEDAWLKYLGAANTDLVFGVISEEFGLLLALCCVAAIVLMGIFVLRCTANARSCFYTITSCATAAMLTVQTALNVLGSVDLLPLTGVTFPFVSMGGSSMMACWGLLAFLKAADTRQNANFSRLPKHTPIRTVPTDEDPSQPEGSFFDQIPGMVPEDIFGKGGDVK